MCRIKIRDLPVFIYGIIALYPAQFVAQEHLSFNCNYFEIWGESYKTGSTLLICKDFGNLEIAAYHEDGTAFPAITGWTGVNSNTNNQATVSINNTPSIDMEGELIRAYYPDGAQEVFVELHLVTVDLNFTDSPIAAYSFDPNTATEYTSYTQTDPPAPGIPWKFLPPNGSADEFRATVLPDGAQTNMYLEIYAGNNLSVAPLTLSGPDQVFSASTIAENGKLKAYLGSDNLCPLDEVHFRQYTEKAKAVTFVIVQEENDDIQLIPPANGAANAVALTPGVDGLLDSSPGGDDIISNNSILTGTNGICETLATGDDVQMIPKDYGAPNEMVLSVGANAFLDTPTPGGDDVIDGNFIHAGPNGICETTANNTNQESTYSAGIDFNAFVAEINTIYGAINLNWTLDEVLHLPVNYDLDHDGFFDPTHPTGAFGADHQAVAEAFNADYPIQMADSYIFLIDHLPDDGYQGFSPLGQEFCFVYPVSCTAVNWSPEKVAAHELGHGAFSLQHPFVEFSPYFFLGEDYENFMDYPPSSLPNADVGTEIRKYQWDQIHSN